MHDQRQESRRTPGRGTTSAARFPVGRTVLVAESDPHLAAHLCEALATNGANHILRAAACEAAIATLPHQPIDVAILASRLADDSGLILLAELAEQTPSCIPLVVIDGPNTSFTRAARRLGARALLDRAALLHCDPVPLLADALQRATAPTEHEIRGALITLLQTAMRGAIGGPRAREARALWSLGLSDKEASAALGISRPTYREALVSAGAFGAAVRGGPTLLKEVVTHGRAEETLSPWVSEVTRRRVVAMLAVAEPPRAPSAFALDPHRRPNPEGSAATTTSSTPPSASSGHVPIGAASSTPFNRTPAT